MQVSTLPSIHLLVNILGLSGSSIPHHCSQSPRHGEVHRRALAEQQVQEQLEPKVPEPEDGRAHADVQTELCSDEPGDHGIKVEMVCQADVHLEQPPSVLCSLAEGGEAMARQAEGREEPCEGRQTPPLQAQEEPSTKMAAWACTEQVLAELFDSSLYIVCESNSSNDPTERGLCYFFFFICECSNVTGRITIKQTCQSRSVVLCAKRKLFLFLYNCS
ncbi:uncharacterized protein LOC141924197 isoform X3 [Strix aluco]|uniref:uncharacterized protein LOC141924197 isoform X3 n=1 Tax=Strix aluco TaxID=111821 RepID=UPI003DA277C0